MSKSKYIDYLEKENIALTEVLKFAKTYVAKGQAEGAYKGCGVKGDVALDRIEKFLDADTRRKIIMATDIKAMRRLL